MASTNKRAALRCIANRQPVSATADSELLHHSATKKSIAKPKSHKASNPTVSVPNVGPTSEPLTTLEASAMEYSYQHFDPNLTRSIFRQPVAMNGEDMDQMWTLKRANPISDDHYASSDDETEVSPQKRQKNTSSTQPLHWNDRLLDDEEITF